MSQRGKKNMVLRRINSLSSRHLTQGEKREIRGKAERGYSQRNFMILGIMSNSSGHI